MRPGIGTLVYGIRRWQLADIGLLEVERYREKAKRRKRIRHDLKVSSIQLSRTQNVARIP